MRRLLLTLAALLAMSLVAPAQQQSPQPSPQNDAAAPAEAQADETTAAQASNVQWLKTFDGKQNSVLQQDPRFQALLADSFGDMEMKFAKRPLVQGYAEFMGAPGGVIMEHNRWIIVTGSRKHSLDRSMLWIDTHTDADAPAPWLVYTVNDVGHHKLYLFSSRNLLGNEDLPHDLRLNVGRWLSTWKRRVGYVDHAYFVGPSGSSEVKPEVVSVILGHFTGH